MLFNRPYSLHKSRTIFVKIVRTYHKKKHCLSSENKHTLEKLLQQLQQALDDKQRQQAHELCLQLEEFVKLKLFHPIWDFSKEALFTLIIALFFAVVFRQMIFEPYEIPTGSMRPTFLEGDKVITSKTTYGINVPCTPKQLYFNPQAVQRNDCIVFTSEGLDIPDNDTKYFFFFPAKKRLVKRCLGLPGDTLYFYGGRIYGFDKEGQEIHPLPSGKLHHIPFISFEGQPTIEQTDNTLVFKQMNQTIGKISDFFKPESSSYIYLNEKWVPTSKNSQLLYKNFFGIRNYAFVNIISKERFLSSFPDKHNENNLLYLEITHSPILELDRSHLPQHRYLTPLLKTEKSYLALQEKHLKALMRNLYTVRFFVENEKAYRYHLEQPYKAKHIKEVILKNVPDGLYEFQDGIAYSIPQGWWGIFSGSARQKLPFTHPLYRPTLKNIKTLFNEGIVFGAHSKHSKGYRYAYFNEGSLYLMGGKVYDQSDPVLKQFLFNEKAKMASGKEGFIDFSPPTKEGRLDKDFIKQFGYKVPDKHYLLLGDNHAQSGDSRDFGAVPFSHLRGSPAFRLWPLDDRFGFPDHPPTSPKSPTGTVWGGAFVLSLIAYSLYRKRLYSLRFENK